MTTADRDKPEQVADEPAADDQGASTEGQPKASDEAAERLADDDQASQR